MLRVEPAHATALWNLACAAAVVSDLSRTIAWLERRHEVGTPLDATMVAAERDFDAIRTAPEFVAAVARLSSG